MENKPDLYRIKYEEDFDDNKREIYTIYVYLTKEEYEEAKEKRSFVLLEPASELEIEAYNCGFEDGVDVATIKYRLEDSSATHDNFHKPTEEELRDIFREETDDESPQPE